MKKLTASAAGKAAAVFLAIGVVLLGAGGTVLYSGGSSAPGGKMPEKTISDYLKAGRTYYNDGRYREAVISYEEVIARETENIEAITGLAQIYSDSMELDRAEELYLNTLEIDPVNADAYSKLTQIYLQKEEIEKAKETLEMGCEKTDSPELKRMLAQSAVPEPGFSIGSGSYDAYQCVTIPNLAPDLTVYYTTDGTEPDRRCELYRDGIILADASTTLKAKAYSPLGFGSGVSEITVNITVPNVPVQISDPALEAALQNTVGRTGEQLYSAQLAKLSKIYLAGPHTEWTQEEISNMTFDDEHYTADGYDDDSVGEIHDLSGLSYCPFLTGLYCSYQDSLDLNSIAGLTNLEELSLIHDGITDISVLSELKNLKKLSLAWNHVSDVSPLSGLSGLTSLCLLNNEIRNINPLASLTKMQILDLSENGLTDLDPLREMKDLRVLWIRKNSVSNLSFTDDMEGLNILMVEGNPVTEYGDLMNKAYYLQMTDLKE